VLVVCDDSKLYRRGVRGVPDWVLEVLSPSTASYDQIKKRELYERYGVREYLMVYPIDKVLTIYRLLDDVFAPTEILELKGETTISVLDDVVIQWDELLERLPSGDALL